MNNSLSVEQLKVRREHLIFNLEEFMKNMGASDGAVVLITPNQIIMTDCFVRNANKPNYGEHGAAVNAIYSAIYKNSEEITGGYDVMWQDLVVRDGNICIQLCSLSSLNVINMPGIISESQYFALEWFNGKVKEIYEKNKDYFDKEPMEFVYWNDDTTLNNIDLMLANVSVNELIDNFKEETIVGSSMEALGYEVLKAKGNGK